MLNGSPDLPIETPTRPPRDAPSTALPVVVMPSVSAADMSSTSKIGAMVPKSKPMLVSKLPPSASEITSSFSISST